MHILETKEEIELQVEDIFKYDIDTQILTIQRPVPGEGDTYQMTNFKFAVPRELVGKTIAMMGILMGFKIREHQNGLLGKDEKQKFLYWRVVGK